MGGREVKMTGGLEKNNKYKRIYRYTIRDYVWYLFGNNYYSIIMVSSSEVLPKKERQPLLQHRCARREIYDYNLHKVF